MSGSKRNRVNLNISVDHLQKQSYCSTVNSNCPANLVPRNSAPPSIVPDQHLPVPAICSNANGTYTTPTPPYPPNQPQLKQSSSSLTSNPNTGTTSTAAPFRDQAAMWLPRLAEQMVASMEPLLDEHQGLILSEIELMRSHINETKDEVQNQAKEMLQLTSLSFSRQQEEFRALDDRLCNVENLVNNNSLVRQLNAISFIVGEVLKPAFAPRRSYADAVTDTEDLPIMRPILVERAASPLTGLYADASIGSDCSRQATPAPQILKDTATSPCCGSYVDAGVEAGTLVSQKPLVNDVATSPVRLWSTNVAMAPRTPPRLARGPQPMSVEGGSELSSTLKDTRILSTPESELRMSSSVEASATDTADEHCLGVMTSLCYSDTATLLDETSCFDIKTARKSDLGDMIVSPRLERKHTKFVQTQEAGGNLATVEPETQDDSASDAMDTSTQTTPDDTSAKINSSFDSSSFSLLDPFCEESSLGSPRDDSLLDEDCFMPSHASPQSYSESHQMDPVSECVRSSPLRREVPAGAGSPALSYQKIVDLHSPSPIPPVNTNASPHSPVRGLPDNTEGRGSEEPPVRTPGSLPSPLFPSSSDTELLHTSGGQVFEDDMLPDVSEYSRPQSRSGSLEQISNETNLRESPTFECLRIPTTPSKNSEKQSSQDHELQESAALSTPGALAPEEFASQQPSTAGYIPLLSCPATPEGNSLDTLGEQASEKRQSQQSVVSANDSELSVTRLITADSDSPEEPVLRADPQLRLHSCSPTPLLQLDSVSLSIVTDACDPSPVTPLSSSWTPLPQRSPITSKARRIVLSASRSVSPTQGKPPTTPKTKTEDTGAPMSIKKPSFPEINQPMISSVSTSHSRHKPLSIFVPDSPIFVDSDSSSPLTEVPDSDSDVAVAIVKKKKKAVVSATISATIPIPRVNLLEKLNLKNGQSGAVTRVKKRKESAPSSDAKKREPPLKRARLRANIDKTDTPSKSASAVGSKGKEKGNASGEKRAGGSARKEKNEHLPESRLRKRAPASTPFKWPKHNPSSDEKFDQRCIQCDLCNSWYHYVCAGIVNSLDVRIADGELFTCLPCLDGHSMSVSEPRAETDPITCARPDCEVDERAPTYFLSALLGRRVNEETGKYQWLVKWDGYSIANCTWEEEDAMSDPCSFIRHFNEVAKREGHDLEKDPRLTILLQEASSNGSVW